MADAKELLDAQFLEMRWRTLSLAADLDRIGRAGGGGALLSGDARVAKLRRAFELLMSPDVANRAERVQMIMSDMTPPPK